MGKLDRLGEERYNNFGSKIVISRYAKSKDIDIYFPQYNWTAKNRKYEDFIRGKVKCPYEPTIYGKGYIGEGEYKITENGKPTKYYRTWHHMLQRCYDEDYKNKYPTYKNCYAEEYMLNFQNFCKWMDENYYEIDGERMCIDKDILHKGNKLYSRDTCLIVPHRINTLFIKNDKNRGKDVIGVRYHKRNNMYEAWCENGNGSHVYLGSYKTENEAFQVYKKFKENLIKQIADEYKPHIPNKLYQAMYRYEVEIND